MYEMLLSKRPFSGENITTLIYSILHNEPEKPSSINPQIPMLFDRIVEKTLAKNPADRFQTAAEVASSLEDFVESFASR
jgi:serine/threonine-protein kinase